MKKVYTFIVLGLFSMQAFSQKSYCLENDVVHSYLTQVTYDPNDYSYTKILDYCDNPPYENHGVRKDHPKPVSITLANALDTLSTLYVSEKTDFSNALTISIAKGASKVDVYNLIPCRTYYYKVVYKQKDGTSVRADSASFKTTGTLRMLKIDNIYNVRDMGGWPTASGYPMKYGKIIRGSRLNINNSSEKIITEDGIKELRRVGIRAELDMRDAGNAANARYSFLGSDIPIYNVNGAYNSRIATFADAPQSIQGILKLIEWLKQDKPVYLHCSVGADRTGTVAYLVGALCGMTEDALCKDFELTSFSSDVIENEAARGTNEILIRRRTAEGRLDECSQKDSYRFANMVAKIKGFQKTEHPEWTLQQRVYWHLKTGVQGYKVPEADLDWLINYLVNPIELNVSGTINMEKGETKQLNAELTSISSENPNPVIAFTSSDTIVAKVSSDGLITAMGGGTAIIKATLDGFEKSVTVSVPLVESSMPTDTIRYGGKLFLLAKNKTNLIKNGSFEYGHSFLNWKGANDKDLTKDAFVIKNYENADSVYIESKADGDSMSVKSLRTMWSIEKGKTYVFGYKVKNSTNTNQSKAVLATSLVTLNPELQAGGDDFEWDNSSNQTSLRTPSRGYNGAFLAFEQPTYGGEWTDVQYVFTNTDGYEYIQVWFTHLSQNGNNTCLDNFFLCEVTETTGVKPIVASRYSDGRIYNLAGQVVTNPGKGVYIKDGKKYIVK